MGDQGEIVRPILSLISNLKVGSDRVFRSGFTKATSDVTSGVTSISFVESSVGQLLVPFLKKTPTAFLSLAFVYLAACNFDPFWIVHDAETEAVTMPGVSGQLQTCIPTTHQSKLAAQQSGTTARDQQLAPTDRSYGSDKSVSASVNPCLPSMELSLRERPHEQPYATAPPTVS